MKMPTRIAASLSLLTLLTSCVFGADSNKPSSLTSMPETTRPNVVLVNVDDMRKDFLPYLPNVQRWMADGGTRFDKAYTSIPSCCPSRAALFSGQYSHNNGQKVQSTPYQVDLNNVLPVWLQDAGYFTGHSGKYIHWWEQNPDNDPVGDRSGVAPGWDRWTQFSGADYSDPNLNLDGVFTSDVPGHLSEILFDRAESYLDDWETQSDNTPFFLSIAPKDPHAGLTSNSADRVAADGWSDEQVNPRFRNAPVAGHPESPSFMEGDRSDKPDFIRGNNLRTESFFKEVWRQQLRMAKGVDARFGQLMQKLEDQGELSNTLVFFTSDNGYLLGEHKWKTKFLPYPASTDVPFLVRWTNSPLGKEIQPQHVNDYGFVNQTDIAATIVDATAAVPGRVLDGRSLLGVTQDSGHKRDYAAGEYWQDFSNNGTIPYWNMYRNDYFQYVEYRDGTGNDGDIVAREYYNLVRDPHMLNNLYATGTQEAARVQKARDLIDQFKTCSGASCP